MKIAWLSMLLAFATTSASAEPRRMIVFASVQGEHPPAQVADLERLAVEESEARPGIEMIVGTVDRASVLRCGSDAVCLSTAFRGSTAELVLMISADYRLEPPLVGVSLIDVSGRAAIALTAADLDKASLRAALSPALATVFDAGGFAAAAVFEAKIQPAEAEVVVTPAPLRAAGRTLWLAPGSYEIKVSREGFVSSQTRLIVEPGARRAIGVRLAEEETVLEPVLWTALIVGAVGATALVAALLVGNDTRCLCVDRGAGCQDGCASN